MVGIQFGDRMGDLELVNHKVKKPNLGHYKFCNGCVMQLTIRGDHHSDRINVF